MLGVGEKFPSFSVTATVSTDPKQAFKTITDLDYVGKWKVYFFWPKDFTFVCPTEIAASGKQNKQFQERDTQILGGSTDSEFVHHAWRTHHEDLKNLPFPMLADIRRDLCGQLGILDPKEGVAAGCFHRRSRGRHPVCLRHRSLGRTQSGGSPARARCPADRRTLPLQLAQGRAHAADCVNISGLSAQDSPGLFVTF